jgi:hypothetical protein
VNIVLGTYSRCWVNTGLYCFVLHILPIQLFGSALFQETALKSVNIWHAHREYITAFIVNELNPVQEKVARMQYALHNWIRLGIFHNADQLKKDQLDEACIKGRPLGRPKCRWEESITMDLKQGGIVGTG